MNTDKQEYDRFNLDRLQAKFQGTYTDEEFLSRFKELLASGNVYARAEKEKLVSEDSGGNYKSNSYWEKLETIDMVDIASVPRPTPSKEDQHGLWKIKNIKLKD